MSVITINRGECLKAAGVWEDEAGPVDLTGMTLALADASHLEITSGGSVTVTNAATGEFDITLPVAVTDALPDGQGAYFRVKLTQPDGCVSTTPRIWVAIE